MRGWLALGGGGAHSKYPAGGPQVLVLRHCLDSCKGLCKIAFDMQKQEPYFIVILIQACVAMNYDCLITLVAVKWVVFPLFVPLLLSLTLTLC